MRNTAEILAVDAHRPDSEAIAKAAAVVRCGGIVVFPTYGLYGLGVDAFNPEAVARIFDLKARDPAKPLLVMIHDRNHLARLVPVIDDRTGFMMNRFWPGRVTFVLAARSGLPPGLTSARGRIGVRLAGHPVAAALIAAVGGPITATSANLSGGADCPDVKRIDPVVRSSADLILDAGPMSGAPSTVVDVTGTDPVVLRAGAVPELEILTAWRDFETRGSRHLSNSV